ncbi:MAG: heme-binding protein [Candidatus Acidiferrales bacterium]
MRNAIQIAERARQRSCAAACGCALFLAACIAGCGGGAAPPGNPPAIPPPSEITAAEAQAITEAAAQSVDVPLVVAVTNRTGVILAVFRKPGAPLTATGNFGAAVDANELAVALARTAAFFSNDQAPLSSRTVRFISGIHFPPGVSSTPNAALYGIENTNRGCSLDVTFAAGKAVAPAGLISGASPGLGVITGKVDLMDSDAGAVHPGGVPLFKQGRLVGGVGVVAAANDVAEFAAFTAAFTAGFGVSPAPPRVVVIDGIALPFVQQTTRPAGVGPGAPGGAYVVGPVASPGPVPDGDLVTPVAGGSGGLSAAEVRTVVDAAVAVADQTRAVIRLPSGSRARMVIAVSDLDGTILGLHRMPDATVFSIDVAVAKARNLVYLSGAAANPSDLPGVPVGTAVTNRTISFGAQPLYPPGIDGTTPGPFFNLYVQDTANPCTNGSQTPGPRQNGIVFFPGSVPLYRNGVLVGALGISGDGVEQDDFVADGGSAGFSAPSGIRADQLILNGARLPYLKFPRNPTD